MTPTQEKLTNREAQRRETRERVFEAAVGEFKRVGIAGADVGEIVSAAGVARGTFYFHFPTKEHALAELTRREEVLIADDLTATLSRVADLRSALSAIAAGVVGEEQRLGRLLFRDVLNLYFSSSHPELNDSATHPIVLIVIEQIDAARARGEVYDEVDSGASGVFFLIGLYGLLVTNRDAGQTRAILIEKYLDHFCRGLASQ